MTPFVDLGTKTAYY